MKCHRASITKKTIQQVRHKLKLQQYELFYGKAYCASMCGPTPKQIKKKTTIIQKKAHTRADCLMAT